jgi:ribonucleotide monophosphatase NagD (HAD superfamily)
MANNSWTYNPLNLLPSFGHLFTSNPQDNKFIKRPNPCDITKINLLIINLNSITKNNGSLIPVVQGSLNIFIKNEIKPICFITYDYRRSPKLIKKELKQLGYKPTTHTKIITPGLITLKYLNTSLKNHYKIINETNQPIKIGIIGENDFFFYIKDNFRLSTQASSQKQNFYKKVKFYWIRDDILPTNMDYMVFSSIKDNEHYNPIKERISRWIINSPKTAFLLTSLTDNSTIYTNDYNPINFFAPLDIFNSALSDIKTSHLEVYNTIKTKYTVPILDNPELITQTLREHYNITINGECDNKHILMIHDNLDKDMILSESIKSSSCLVLTGHTTLNMLSGINKDLLDKVDFVVPDASYCLI